MVAAMVDVRQRLCKHGRLLKRSLRPFACAELDSGLRSTLQLDANVAGGSLLTRMALRLQDGMITEHDVVENGSPADRCQVVRWIRSFPFAFIGDREYVIARRQFRDPNGCIYVMTKSVEHPRVPTDDSAVRM